jgi:hypothetical protein
MPNYYEFVGAWMSTVTIEVNTESIIDREQLITIIKMIFMNVRRDELYTRGIHVIRVNHGGESEVPYHNDFVYKQTVNVEIYSEWTNRIPVGDLIEAINVQVQGPISTDAFIFISSGGRIDPNLLPISFVDESRNLKPDAICDTIEWSVDHFDITAEWMSIIQRSFTLAELHTLFGITAYADLTVEDFLFALIVAHSASRESLSDVVESINLCIAGLANGAQKTELGLLRDGLITRFYSRVIRFTPPSVNIPPEPTDTSEVTRYLSNLTPMENPTSHIYRDPANIRYVVGRRIP